MLRFLTAFIVSFLFVATNAQTSEWCIQGIVLSADDAQAIPSVHVTTIDGRLGTVTDLNGEFELCGLKKDTVSIQIGHTSFERKLLTVNRSGNSFLELRLALKVYGTDEIQINAEKNNIVKNYIPGKLTLKKEDILAIPAFLGSPDVLRGLQLLPGMQSVSEGNSGIYVRGGSPGQNYVLFDDIELMNPTHLMGIYSVFNPLLTNQVEFYKGNAPVHLSSRLASSIVVDTYQHKPDSSNWAGNIGNIITNLCYMGESKDKKWFVSSGFRRSYLDLLGYMARPLLDDEDNYFEQNNYTFYDWNGKLRYRSGNHQLALSWYTGRDNFKMESPKNDIQSHSKWGNTGLTLNWKLRLNPRFYMENLVTFTAYDSDFGATMPDGHMRFATDYQQYQFKNRFTREADAHLFRWGIELSDYKVIPQDLKISYLESSETTLNTYESVAAKVYFSDHFRFNERFSVYAGLAMNYYQMRDITGDEMVKNSFEPIVLPNAVISFNYDPTQQSSYKFSYAYNTQNIHLASIASIPLPSDVWMPATENLQPENSHQLTLGYFKSNTDRGVQWGIEAYARKMDHQLLVKLNLNNEQIDRFEENFYQGQGAAYGTELYFNKHTGKAGLTVGYTLGWARQQFNEINDGRWHDAKYDRRHDLNVQTNYNLNKRLDIGAVFIYASGNKATLPTGRYWMMGTIANDYTGVNNYRMPAYHRLDLSLNYKLKSKVFDESIINFSIINIYGRSNPYFVYYEIDKANNDDYELSINAKQVSLFPIMPSLSWRFKF
ncbi:MAG: TonB-dependent receptor [Carboxylicivirga sp.]|nr:TonB-dependent receptor [Carboxylicivirga sp.]